MIEVVYKDEKEQPEGNESFFQVPKNIRQIGQVDEGYKIYIEDYAYHYLDRIADEVSSGKIALLLGKANWKDGVTYIFIKGAFELKGMEVDLNHIPFQEQVWAQAHEIMEDKFPDLDVVGWFFTMPECAMELTEVMYRTHLNYFGGNDKVFFMMEPLDQEEMFFRYDNGKMYRQHGYYLYYERNDRMQEYMIEENQNIPMEKEGEVPDQAVKNFREIISHKIGSEKEEKHIPYFMYASTAAAVLLVLAIGSGFLNDYQELKDTQGTVQRVISQVEGEEMKQEELTPTVSEEGNQNDDNTKIEETIQNDASAQEKEVNQNKGSTQEKETNQNKGSTQENEANQNKDSTQNKESDQKDENAEKEIIEETVMGASQTQYYTIQPGDTLTSISRSIYGDTKMVDTICQKNQLSKDAIIYPGEKILLP